MDLPYAENINYWKSGQSQPEKWLESAAQQIRKLGGEVAAHGFGRDLTTGKQAYFMAFQIEGQQYKIVQPVLESKSGNDTAARRQAATLIYHDVKAKCLRATVVGHHRAFFNYILLPDGRTAEEATLGEVAAGIPYVSRKEIEYDPTYTETD